MPRVFTTVRGLCLLAALATAPPLHPAAWAAAPEAQRMLDVILSNGEAAPPHLNYQAEPLSLPASMPERAAARPEAGYLRALGGPAQSSRSPGSLPPRGTPKVLWQVALGAPVLAVMLLDDRVVAQTTAGWQLLSRSGNKLAEGKEAGALITLDGPSKSLYTLGIGQSMNAYSLKDGALLFSLPLGHNETYVWSLLCRSGQALIATAVESRQPDPHRSRPGTQSLVQVTMLGASPMKLSPYKTLLSADSQLDLIFKDPKMAAAVAGSTIWLMLPNLIVRTSPAQKLERVWSAVFEPVAMSADELGWLHAVVSVADQRELWVITPEGMRVARALLSAEQRVVLTAPAIGYDHRFYVWSAQRIAAFAKDGRHLWDCPLARGIRGVNVSPDGRLTATAGQELYVISADGKAAPLYHADEPFTTAPLVTPEGEILVGSGDKLLYLGMSATK